MTIVTRPTAALMILLAGGSVARGADCWQVDDVRAGMKGVGRTVMTGTKIETFSAEVLGVLKNTSPGRDMVLCRLSGLNLEKTGVIAGMSGSPIYIDNKILGAVAYTWAFGKEPIAGVTPFCQMKQYAERFQRPEFVGPRRENYRVRLDKPIVIGSDTYKSATVSTTRASAGANDGMCLVPLRMPVAATGFSARSLRLLRESLPGSALMPVQSGAAGKAVARAAAKVPLRPGGPLAIALVTGDFDMSGIGTVTHIEGDKVYGWGHPFLTLGPCEFPLMTGYIHTVLPRQNLSFKLGSPLRMVGTVNADTSTGVAGLLGRTPRMLPVEMIVRRDAEPPKTFRVQVTRERSMMANLVHTVLCNSVDMEGRLPEEVTVRLHAAIEVRGREPIVIDDVYSGSLYSGARAPMLLYQPVGNILNILTYNSFQPVDIERITCRTHIVPGRRSAEIQAVEPESDVFAPGETVKASAILLPHEGKRQRLTVSLQLPPDLPEGKYTALICDELTHARHEMRADPNLTWPQNLDHVFESVRLQTRLKRTNLVLRLKVPAKGVALNGHSLPSLPPGMVHLLSNTRRTGAMAIRKAICSRKPTPWVIEGSDSFEFRVRKNKGIDTPD